MKYVNRLISEIGILLVIFNYSETKRWIKGEISQINTILLGNLTRCLVSYELK